jgi:ribosomal protein S18 acetylase RimI-like enzyme
MINFTSHSRESINVAELAAFTQQAYRLLPIPYKHGESVEEITTFLKQRCPDFMVLAREAGALLGWAGLYLENLQANLLSWHPLVIPPNPAISQQLVRECIQHTAASGREQMEVLLLNLTPEYRDYAAQCGSVYQAAGMVRRAEWRSMEADVQQLDFAPRDIPDMLTLRPLAEVSKDELWPCFDAAFTHGVDRRYAQQSTAKRREDYEAFFCRQIPPDEDVSLALVDDETVVGFVQIQAAAEQAYLVGIGVIPAYRKRGLARYLLETGMRRAAANQCQKVILQVDSENQAALGLYLSLGFRNVNKGWVSYFWNK